MSRARTTTTRARVWVSATIAPHTLARLDALATRLDTSRGVIIDLALDALEECEACHGEGRIDTEPRGRLRCYDCAGHGVIPRERD